MRLIEFRRMKLENECWSVPPPSEETQLVRVGGIPGITQSYAFRRPVLVWRWEIAFSKEHLDAKLNGAMAEVVMPEEPMLKRMWFKLFPRGGIEYELQES